jgi:hypothetical protein
MNKDEHQFPVASYQLPVTRKIADCNLGLKYHVSD